MSSNILAMARRIRRSTAFKDAIATPKRWAVRLRQRANGGILSVEIRSNSGFFATMQTILLILVYCEQTKIYPDISARGGNYGEETGTVDWFGRLFESLAVPSPGIAARLIDRRSITTSRIKGVEELGFRSSYDDELSLAEASALFNGYYRPRADVIAEVDLFCKKLGVSGSTIGVHYRGNDKIHEAGRVPWETITGAVEATANRSKVFTRICLASDETEFIDFFQNHEFPLPVTILRAAYMPKGNTPIHFSGHPGIAIGREALLTCLLLSRCGCLIKTPSYLSGWAKLFNPALPTWLISPPIGGGLFPDRALWLDQVSGKAGIKTHES